jgi:hypothetical protein
MKFQISPEIRAGDILATVGVIVGGALAWSNVQADLRSVKEAQAVQVITNREMRQEFREVSQEIKGDIKDLRREMRPRNAGQM